MEPISINLKNKEKSCMMFHIIHDLFVSKELRTEAVQKHCEGEQTRKYAKLVTNFNSLKKFDEIG